MTILISFHKRPLKTIFVLVGYLLFSFSAGCSSSVEKQIEEAEREERQMEKLFREKGEEILKEAETERDRNPTAEFLKSLSEVPPAEKQEKGEEQEGQK